MSAADPIIAAHPRTAQWIDLREPGVVRAYTGRVEMGQGTTLALRGAVAAALSVNPARVALTAGDTRVCPDEGYTAGSRSIEQGGLALRRAALSARVALLERARELLQHPPGELSVADGVVLLDGRETGLDWWRLAGGVALPGEVGEAAGAPPAPDLSGEAAAAIRARIRGGGFIHDVRLPDMLHARVVAPPAPGLRLASFDAAAVEALPGVVAVVRDGSFVAVVARDEWAAVRAAAKAEGRARWEGEADGPAETILDRHAEAPVTLLDRGGPAAAEGARVAVEASRPFLAHASLGPACALARWDGGRLTVWSHAQGPHALRDGLALALGLAPEVIDVIHAPGAGCYGHNGADDVAFEAALIARAAPGRPVRLLWSRADELSRAPFGAAMRTRAEAVVAADGRIAAMTLDIVSTPHLRRPGPGKPNFAAGPLLERPVPLAPATEPPPAGGGGADRNGEPLYAIPGVAVRRRLAARSPVRSSALRSLGAFVNVIAIETLMDLVADAAGRDPLDLRREHLDDPRGRAVLDRAAEMADWGRPRADGAALGLGLARYKNKAGWCAVCAEVVVTEAVSVRSVWAAADVGEAFDAEGARAQIEGGVLQAISWTLREAVAFDERLAAGRSWTDYPVLVFSEAPEIETALIPRPNDPPLGAGEIAQGPAGAAVVCAVRRALGLTCATLPLTRDRLAAAMLAEP